MTTNEEQIRHHAEQQRFTLQLDGAEAVLDYRMGQGAAGRTSVDFTHTFVPPQFRGKGLAEKLVRRGLSWAREQGYEIQASCWYARMFLRE